MSDLLLVEPLSSPPDARVTIPGSKSFTNRALVLAALAEGTSRLDGVLFADDTEAMLDSLSRLGIRVAVDRQACTASVAGTGGTLAGEAGIDCRLSGTTARFLAPVVALGSGRFRVDGASPLRSRPMGPLLDALRALGATIAEEGEPGHLPVAVVAAGLGGGRLPLRGDISSQYLSGLLMAGPLMREGLRVDLTTRLVSRPYVDITAATMRAFGAEVETPDAQTFIVPPARYQATHYCIEPDASAASYLFAAAAITAGRVSVPGLSRDTLQGDARFCDLIARMGARVVYTDDAIEVIGTGQLHGIEADMSDLSDTAQTLAAVAVFADSPTRVTGIGFIRGKETDRVAAVVRELQRCGIDAVEEQDGFLIRPGVPRPARIETYHDHRMAMSFALLGLRVPGIEIGDPGCVAKTFPGYWDALSGLRHRTTRRVP